MKTHELKTWPAYFEAILQGWKPWEVRVDDRGFNLEDQLLLKEYSLVQGFTGREMLVKVTYITVLPMAQVRTVGMTVKVLASSDEPLRKEVN